MQRRCVHVRVTISDDTILSIARFRRSPTSAGSYSTVVYASLAQIARLEKGMEAEKANRSKLLRKHKKVKSDYRRELSDRRFTADKMQVEIKQARKVLDVGDKSWRTHKAYRKVKLSTEEIESMQNELKGLVETSHDLELQMSKANAEQQNIAQKVATYAHANSSICVTGEYIRYMHACSALISTAMRNTSTKSLP